MAKVAVVTGGGRGLGLEISRALARSGASVAIGGRSSDALDNAVETFRSEGLDVRALPVDVTDEKGVDDLLTFAEHDLGPIDILVNNAGITEHGEVWTTDASDWWEVIRVNLLGTFLCSRAVLQRMVPRRQGRIVNVGSYAGNEGNALQSAYAVSKAAVLRLTDSLAAQASRHGVHVFAISPGRLDTDMGRTVTAWSQGPQPQTHALSEAASLVVEIASGHLDPLVGRLIHVDDDRNQMLEQVQLIRTRNLYQLGFARLADVSTASAASR